VLRWNANFPALLALPPEAPQAGMAYEALATRIA